MLLVGGVLAQIAMFATGDIGKAGDVTSTNPYLEIFTTLGTFGALGLILYYRHSSNFVLFSVIGGLMLIELVWGIVEQSKTPFLGTVLAVIIRIGASGISRARAAGIVVGGVAVGAMFSWLQSFKVGTLTAQAAMQAASADLEYPPGVRPFLSIFRRFDLFEAATDVYYMNGRPWISPAELAHRAVIDLIPSQLGVTKYPSGVEWATNVRGSSVDMSQVTVSLAEGHFNEGYLVAGYAGVFAESFVVLAMIFLVARCLRSRHIYLLGLAFVELPPLFERGVLGISETVGKTLQQMVVAAIVALAVAQYRSFRAHRARAARPQTPSTTERVVLENAHV
ncbi:hypothetical protein FOS14_08205 [Skermania sp. ID1734]|uniref:hypothetical protein n=1 Tax=Skermania sp. ID1734 TaxID=2597516 RepID=UPI00118053EF|nr:hypothetical protein [Skermania sp. ID1734]TSE00393.1 hypothetical protein FOS14_08205 [Skermania sp. ID1734]